MLYFGIIQTGKNLVLTVRAALSFSAVAHFGQSADALFISDKSSFQKYISQKYQPPWPR